MSALDARIQETVLTQWVEAFNARNLDGMLSCLSVGVEFHPLKLGGARDCYHGHRGVREWFAQLDGPGDHLVRDQADAVAVDVQRHVILGQHELLDGRDAVRGDHQLPLDLVIQPLQHRPIDDAAELRQLTADIARMKTGDAQVRALDALARYNISDRESLDALTGLFPLTRSVAVQRAIAGVLLRADYHALEKPELTRALRRHRLKSPGGADPIDVLIRRLES